MKVLYAIQATGNGHISRAKEIIPILNKHAEVDLFLSGSNSNLELPFPIKYRSKGLSLEYTASGGLSYTQTLKKADFWRLSKEIRDFPVNNYDLIINDFESISAWAAWYRQVPCISFSHQVSLLSEKSPKPENSSFLGKMILRKYAPAAYAMGLHFKRYDDYIFTPVIRKEIRALQTKNCGHFTVYLPAVSDRNLLAVLHQMPEVRWEVFSRLTRSPYLEKNVVIRPAHPDFFINSLSGCAGLLTNAGFESPAEALFLKKKVFVVPITGQYEQQCNASALRQLGVPTGKTFGPHLIPALKKWIQTTYVPQVHYPDLTEQLVEHLLYEQDSYWEPMIAAG